MPRNPFKRPYAHSGCRAWAKRGHFYCWRHLPLHCQELETAPASGLPDVAPASPQEQIVESLDVATDIFRRAFQQLHEGLNEKHQNPVQVAQKAGRLLWAMECLARMQSARCRKPSRADGDSAQPWLDQALPRAPRHLAREVWPLTLHRPCRYGIMA